MSMESFDVLVIGAGIAGASVAAQLAPRARVAVLEREAQPGYHATGRSAALFSACYGNEPVRALSRASREFLFAPPAGFCDAPLTRPRGSLYVARDDQLDALAAFVALPDVAGHVQRIDVAEAYRRAPLMRPGYVAGAAFEPGAVDIDVHGLHHGFLRRLREAGGRVVANAGLTALDRAGDRWIAETTAGRYAAPIVVDAAGAWADAVAALAGVAAAGVAPLRRTALIVDEPSGIDCRAVPMTIDIDEEFYFKPDAGKLLLSPADETPSEPCDAMPDDMDVALAVDRVERATVLDVRRVHHAWAGLRSFAPDRSPVVGFDPDAPGFFWLAGQGGYGMQTAPALSRLAAALVLGDAVPADLAAHGVDAKAIAPRR
jgi:D-arginine dehydrogenase